MKTRIGVRATDQGWGQGLGVELSPTSLRTPAGSGWRDFFEVAKRTAVCAALSVVAYGIAAMWGCM